MARRVNTRANHARTDPVLRLVRRKKGTAARIARDLGISRPAVWRWRRVPAEHVMRLESLLNIPRHRIRPDIYPPAREAR
jgi:pyruvate kinase